MNFIIISGWEQASEKETIYLSENNWDDYGYETTFNASFCDIKGVVRELGTVKIAKREMPPSNCIHDVLKEGFDSLSDEYYSLWQTAEAYKRVMECQKECHFNILSSLRDIAYTPEIYDQNKNENALRSSLFRYVPPSLYINQFRRIARGEAALTPYHFRYTKKSDNPLAKECVMDFSVEPDSLPPTNVHAIIGSNGTGKTTLIKQMIRSLCKGNNQEGMFNYSGFNNEEGVFENIICISYSPFDDYSEIEECNKNCKFIGIRKEYDSKGYEDGYGEISLLEDTSNNFLNSLENCLKDLTKKDDIKEIIEMLETECNFLSANYELNLNVDDLKPDDLGAVEKAFEQLSAGHKVVLSIITRCIDELVEKSVMFIDEPENHLHPPLLSSLIRGISKMLIKRNGVAIVSTHSPIVLQEIPKSCVWIINRVGAAMNVRRPEIETFGSNIGVLTNEIFGYEVQRTGFNTMLKNSVNKYNDYERVLEEFNYQLGDEAKSILRIMLKQKEQ